MMTDEVQTITNMASCAENVISSHDDNDIPGQDASEVSVSSGKRKTGPNSNQPIWDYFGDVENGVQCILCKTKLKMKERFTSNAKKHLKSRHKDKVQEFEEMEKLYNEKPKKDVDHSQANIGNFFVDVKSKGRPCSKNQLRKLDELTQQNILPELCDAITFWINDYFKYILSMKDSGFNATYLVATALHPSLARSLKDTVEEPQLFRARQEIQNLLHLEIEISPNEQTAVVADIPVDESCSQVFCGGLFPHLQKETLHERPASMLSSISLVDDEVHSYFKQLPNYSIIDDALQFWIGNSSMFPNLSKLACNVLAIPAASAAVESVFSVCGHATSGRRHNLTVNLEKEVMIKVNKKFL